MAYAMLEWNEGWGVYPDVGALLPPILLVVCVCSVCKGGEGQIAYYFTS